jgi:hypothetical protein
VCVCVCVCVCTHTQARVFGGVRGCYRGQRKPAFYKWPSSASLATKLGKCFPSRQAAGSRQQAAGSRQQAAGSRQLLVGSAGILKGLVSSSLTPMALFRGAPPPPPPPPVTGHTLEEAASNSVCIIVNCGDSGLVQCPLWDFSKMGHASLTP